MAYKIIGDSCTDVDLELEKYLDIATVSLFINIDDKSFIDNDDLDKMELIREMKASPNYPRTACPSPKDYLEFMEAGPEDVYVVTLSSELSGSYNSALMAKDMYYEDHNEKNIHVFNSRSAAAGQTAIAMKIKEVADSGLAFEEVVETVEKYIDEMVTMFVLELIDNLEKNGRLSKVKSKLVNILNIKLVMETKSDGSIGLRSQARGMKKALLKMIEVASEKEVAPETKRLVISHVNNLKRAEFVKAEIEKVCDFMEIVIVPAKGITTVYANDGGIVIAF